MFLFMKLHIPFIGRFTMDELAREDQEKIAKFFELFLSLILRGFDEMEMQKRLELVKLFGFLLDFGFEKTYGRINNLEKRLCDLESNKEVKKK